MSKPKVLVALVLIREHNHILLQKKKRGPTKGKWTGIAGRVEQEESIMDAAVRKVKVDCGLEISEEALRKYGTLDYEVSGHTETMCVHVFLVTSYTGELKSSDDYDFKWFPENNIPYHAMCSDDKLWLPVLLKRYQFLGHFASNVKDD